MIHHNSKIVTVLVGLLFLLATAAMTTDLPLDTCSSGYAVTEASPSLAGKWIEKANTNKSGAFGEAVVGTDDYIYIAWCRNNTTQPQFWRYDPNENEWNYSMSNSSLPKGAFRNGAALAWDGDDYIYALSGGRYEDLDRYSFYRYEISEDIWTQMNHTLHPQGAGDAMTWVDGSVYAIVGDRDSKKKSAFARYNCSSDLWTNLTMPKSWKNRTDDGASLSWARGKYLYALQGEVNEDKHQPNTNFTRYDILNETWKDMKFLELEVEGIGDGGSLLWIGDWMPNYNDYIFALGGASGLKDEDPGYNFYSYSISRDTWQKLKSIRCPIGYYVGNRLGFADGHIYYWQGSPTSERWVCGGNAFFMFEFSPAVSITTDSHEYHLGDTMNVSLEIINPTEESVTFEWYWGVPQHSIWVRLLSVPIPADYDEMLNYSFAIPDLGSTPFGNIFYVQLLNANGGILDAEAECWAYSPSGEVALAVDIREKINKAIKWWSSDEERKGNEI